MSAPGRLDRELLELAYAYALDAVTERERRAIERRRARADSWTAAQFDSTVSALHETLAEVSAVDICSPPPELERNLLDALDRVIRAAKRRARTRAGAPGRLLFAAAALLVVVLGTAFAAGTHRTPDPAAPSTVIEQIMARPDSTIRFAPVLGGGEIQVRTSISLGATALTFRGVAAPPQARCYQVWLVRVGERPRSTAVLDLLPDGPVTAVAGSGDTLAITVEAAGGSAQPTTAPITSLNLG